MLIIKKVTQKSEGLNYCNSRDEKRDALLLYFDGNNSYGIVAVMGDGDAEIGNAEAFDERFAEGDLWRAPVRFADDDVVKGAFAADAGTQRFGAGLFRGPEAGGRFWVFYQSDFFGREKTQEGFVAEALHKALHAVGFNKVYAYH